ncbi:MAG: hypothetical protein WBM54_05835 [Woeseia sp.]
MKIEMSTIRYAITLSTLLLGSFGANAEPASDAKAIAAPQQETREQADSAHREAVTDALLRISASTRLDLDVELPSRVSQPMSGD